jgi:DivIVA domain-containing protein
VALDRQSIEKRDFPIARRGYDPAAVDEHLAQVADEYDSVRRQSRTRTDSLASAASEQVRLIVEAAEQSAQEIEREAELEARQIRQDAREAAETLRNDAGTQSREHVQRVSEAAQSMLDRIASMESELSSLLEHLRTGAGRLSSDLTLLQGTVSDVRGITIPEPEPAPEPAQRRPAPEPEPEAVAETNGSAGDVVEEEPAASDGGAGADEEGARLIALNMALNGTPREETERYLADNFELADAGSLLDDVYARAGQ